MKSGLSIDGGMSKNPYFIQFLANAMQREIRPAKMPELTGLGTIQLAADFPGYDLKVISELGSVHPETGKLPSTKMFERAVKISRQWPS